jgi:hypothetical protein
LDSTAVIKSFVPFESKITNKNSKQETDATQQSPGTPDEDQEATRREPGPSDQDSDLTTSDSTTQGTLIPKSTSPSSSEADQASPPFWPTSPLSKRLRSKPSPAASSPSLPRRCITSLPSSPQVSRVQPGRRVTGNTSSTVHSQHKSSPNKLYSSPAARSLRSISAAQSPSRKEQEQQQRRVSAHSQGSPQRDEEKSG